MLQAYLWVQRISVKPLPSLRLAPMMLCICLVYKVSVRTNNFAHFALYARNWFAPKTMYQGTNGQGWCIRSPAQVALKCTLVSLEGPWNTGCLNTDGQFRIGMWLHLLWQNTHGPLATVWTYRRVKLLMHNPLWPHGVSWRVGTSNATHTHWIVKRGLYLESIQHFWISF